MAGLNVNKENIMGTLIVLLVGVITGIIINRNGKVTVIVKDQIKKLNKLFKK